MKRKNTIQNKMETLTWADINKLGEKELRALTSKYASAANKRIKRFKERGESSPATEAALQGRDKFSIKGKNYNEVKRELADVSSFLKMQTSTYKGYQKYVEDAARRSGFLTPGMKGAEKKAAIEASKKYWSEYRKYEEAYPNDFIAAGSDLVQTALKDIIEDPNYTIDELGERIDDLYEEYELERQATIEDAEAWESVSFAWEDI